MVNPDPAHGAAAPSEPLTPAVPLARAETLTPATVEAVFAHLLNQCDWDAAARAAGMTPVMLFHTLRADPALRRRLYDVQEAMTDLLQFQMLGRALTGEVQRSKAEVADGGYTTHDDALTLRLIAQCHARRDKALAEDAKSADETPTEPPSVDPDRLDALFTHMRGHVARAEEEAAADLEPQHALGP